MDSGTLTSDDPELTGSGGPARSSLAPTLPEHRRLGHYLLLDELGRGGMGVVYAAHDSKLGRKVAIKMLGSAGDPKLQRRLIREAKAMAKLAHPNVVSVHEIGEHDGAAFIVMEYVDGQTLRRWLAATPRSVAEVLAAFMAAGRGLAAIHEAGLIHRDFKPDNVMIRDSGQVLVMDLGIARDRGNAFTTTAALEGPDDPSVDLTRDGALMGSPAYMAAEQFNGAEVTPKTDQFSFCVSLWEALYGERPFAGETIATLSDAVIEGRTRAAKRREVPAALRSVLERGLQAQPQARFESMTALLAALEHASRSHARVRTRLAWAAASLAGLALIVVGASQGLDRAPSSADATIDAATPSEPLPVGDPVIREPSGHRQLTTTGTATRPALSPDGDHVVFVDDGGLVHVDLRTGETTNLAPRIDGVLESHLSNDATLMFSAALAGEDGVYRMSSLDAAPTLVDSNLLIFCRFPARDLFASIELTGKLVKLSNAAGSLIAEFPVEGEYEWLRYVACDPHSNRVAVLHKLGATSTLVLIDLDGGPARVLLESSVQLSSPYFDSTGETLFYLATRDGQTNLEATRVAANDDLPVTRVVIPDIDATAFSRADSGRIAYARTRTVHHGIWRLGPTDGSLDHAEQIVETDAELLFFAVSPDQTQLAYVESRRDLSRLMVRTLSDGAEREVTRGNRLRHLAWSPDQRTIAFVAQYLGRAHVWTVPAAGGMPTVFKRALTFDEPPLAWAPSESIIYERPEMRNFGVLNPSTEDDRPLIADDSVGFPFFPVVAPDGKSVVVLWSRAQLGLWIIDIEHGTPRLLLEGEYYPNGWSDDGRFVYAATPDKSTVTFHRIPVEPAADGRERLEPWRTVDFGARREGECQVSPTGVLLCAVVETTSDIWIAEASE